MGSITLAVSPLIQKYSVGSKNNALNVQVVGNVAGRLIPQEGITGGNDEFNMDTITVPFKIFAGSNWKTLIPTRGDTVTGLPNFVVWDPIKSYRLGRMFVEVSIMLKGLMFLNGVNNQWDGFNLNPPPKPTIGIGQAQISGTDGSSVADITFSRPQTVYKYVTTTDIVTPPDTVLNPNQRFPKILSFAVRGSNTVPDQGDDDQGPATYVGYNLGTRQRCVEVSSVQVGNYYQNEAVVVYEFYDTANPS